MLLFSTWFGTFLLDDGKVVKSVLFPKDPEALAERMLLMEAGKELEEERRLADGLDDFFVAERRLEGLGGTFTTEAPPFLRPEDYGLDTKLLRDTMIALGKLRMKRAVQPTDHIIQAVRALDDLTQRGNLMMERLRDWYSLHFPELARMVDQRQFLDLVADHGRREDMPLQAFESMGADLDEEDLRAVQSLARLVREVQRERASLGAYLEDKMRELAPNIAHLAGHIIGARLISLAGGLEELGRMPASTIQLLGAEKALFRHLRKGTRPPKHGVLFQHPWVHQAPYWQRGAIARALAAKLAIAARADAYTKRWIGEELKAQMEEALVEIRRAHERPPERPRKRGKKRSRRRHR
ncbi:MAG: NOP5/NOP56 family protein [Thermoplasmata archaeon]